MRLVMHTVICCCVLIVVLPLGNSVTRDANTGLKKRLRVWLQTRVKRDQHSSLGTICEQCPDVQDVPQRNMTTETLPTSSSFGLKVRSRRSAAGCVLITCGINVLIHRLNHFSNHKKQPSAPKRKVDAGGYGRRRRRSLMDPHAGLQTGQRRWHTENRARTAA
ncbi:ADM [Thalassophryne amazonica]|uniref:ADM n=1 Tax=Thalassophryne amazonica TaxID=390379 RepID=UPI0014724BDC|nr:ADM [Thalassophryne amazonica]